jgi:hypothetical protein
MAQQEVAADSGTKFTNLQARNELPLKDTPASHGNFKF